MEWTGLDLELAEKTFRYLKKLHLPVTGATWKNYLETTNKDTMKQAFTREHIQTPSYQIFKTGNETVQKTLQYPVIVKPAYEHGSIGLNRKSIAHSEVQLKKIVRKQISQFHQPAIAETFIKGRELLVYLLEENDHVRILPIEEIVFDNAEDFAFQTYECKWDSKHQDYKNAHVVRAKLSKKQQQEIKRVCFDAFKKLGFRGYARFDLRLKNGTPFVLETNANPNIYDSDEDQIPGIDFPDFVEAIINSAIYHYNHGWKI
jgi:D-alanine-D-alanine ligase